MERPEKGLIMAMQYKRVDYEDITDPGNLTYMVRSLSAYMRNGWKVVGVTDGLYGFVSYIGPGLTVEMEKDA